MSTERTQPKYSRDGNGYVFQYRYKGATGVDTTRSVRVAKINSSEWQASDYYSDNPFEGTVEATRAKSAHAAMDAIDREVEEEKAMLQVAAEEKPADGMASTAVNIPDITGPSPLGPHVLGGSLPPVKVTRTVQPVPAPQANVLPHLRPADQAQQDEAWRRREAVEGAVVGRWENGTKGSLPKDADHKDVRAALRVLGGTQKHHMSLKLALLRDEYDETEPSTYDENEARGAWVVPAGQPGMVKIYALLAGKHTRFAHRYPRLSKDAAHLQEATWTMEKKIYADRFHEAGWFVEQDHTPVRGRLGPRQHRRTHRHHRPDHEARRRDRHPDARRTGRGDGRAGAVTGRIIEPAGRLAARARLLRPHAHLRGRRTAGGLPPPPRPAVPRPRRTHRPPRHRHLPRPHGRRQRTHLGPRHPLPRGDPLTLLQRRPRQVVRPEPAGRGHVRPRTRDPPARPVP
ncbi:hypothetical protein OG285_32435 [Streptomyces sp. NBC_01471]|uniref:hypothetical protein n=1 Tax=Streptomyces sp. NBC_01471 TaxID=2903879 RepID=UPI0032493799